MRNRGVSGFVLRHQTVVRGVFTALLFFAALTGYGATGDIDVGVGRNAEFTQVSVNHGMPLSEQRGKHHGLDASACVTTPPVVIHESDFSSHHSVARETAATFLSPPVLLLRTVRVTSDL